MRTIRMLNLECHNAREDTSAVAMNAAKRSSCFSFAHALMDYRVKAKLMDKKYPLTRTLVTIYPLARASQRQYPCHSYLWCVLCRTIVRPYWNCDLLGSPILHPGSLPARVMRRSTDVVIPAAEGSCEHGGSSEAVRSYHLYNQFGQDRLVLHT